MTRFQRLRAFCLEETGSVGRAAFLLATASILSRLLGVLRDRLLATYFGAGAQLDAYYAAFRLPDTIYNLIILGALSAGFLPMLAELRAKDGKDASLRFASLVLGWVSLVLVVCALIGSAFAPQIVPWFVHGFDRERLSLTVQLSRLLFLSPVLLGISAVFGGVLQSARKTLAFAFAPVWYNVGILAGIVVLAPRIGVMGVVIGVLAGAALHAGTQGIGAIHEGIRWPAALRWTADMRRLLLLTLPRLAALGASQLSLVILLSLASTLPTGSVAVFQLGNNLQSFPLGVIGISFAVAAFPLLSEAAGKGSYEEYHAVLGKTGRRIIFFLLPMAGAFILLRAQLVRLILGDGAFDWGATIATAEVVGWFAVSLPAQALIPLLTRGFYALQSTWTPFIVTIVIEVVNLVSAWLLRDAYGVAGLAMAFSLATCVQLVLLWGLLSRRVGADSQRQFVRLALCSFAACIPALVLGWGARQLVGTVFPLRTFWQVALQFSVSMMVIAFVYMGSMYGARIDEARELVGRVKRLVI